jgi:hypothetical protein
MNLLKLSCAAAAAALLATSADASDLIVNGGFETGDLSGWIFNDAGYAMFATTSHAHSGAYGAQITGYSYLPDTLEQDVPTVAGRHYQLTFWRWQDAGLPNGLSLTWNGVTIFDQVDNTDDAGFQKFSYFVPGHGTDPLIFTSYNDPLYTYVDDISVQLVPEPATWTLMIGGLGLTGAMLRRRRSTLAA